METSKASSGIAQGATSADDHRHDMDLVLRVLSDTEPVDRAFGIAREEFEARRRNVARALSGRGHAVGFVFSDEHYCGDVPYLGGNVNVSMEQALEDEGRSQSMNFSSQDAAEAIAAFTEKREPVFRGK